MDTVEVQAEQDEGLQKKKGSLTPVSVIKKELEGLLARAGYAATEYLVVLPARPTDKWVAENGVELIEGKPTISSKDGTVMYNFSGRISTGPEGRIGGNHFLPLTVGPKMFARFLDAKAQVEADKQAKRRPSLDDDMEAGESTE